MAKVVHLTSVHRRHDTRIFLKMCTSLAAQGHDVSLIVADGQGAEVRDGVNIIDVGVASGGRLQRMTQTVKRVVAAGAELDPDILHLHDPELMPSALRLRRQGKTVVFDAHEDFARQIYAKPYLPLYVRGPVSFVADVYERYAAPKFSAIVSATPDICEKFAKLNDTSVTVGNYPLVTEFAREIDWSSKKNEVAYVGGMSKVRGIVQLVSALEFVGETRLNIAGSFSEDALAVQVRAMGRWERVNDMGFLSREDVASLLSRSFAGIVTFLPSPNHLTALPTKMFEYMSAGVPVIVSDFPLWRDIIDKAECGLCVDPADPEAIAGAIRYLHEHPDEAHAMGRSGQDAVKNRFNWSIEAKKLFALYEDLLA